MIRVRAILTDDAVPLGRMYRQWDTNGELWVYVNPAEIAALPHRVFAPTPFEGLPLFGIPVYRNRNRQEPTYQRGES